MKKLVFFLALATTVAFSACGNKESKTETTEETPVEDVVVVEETVAANDSVVVEEVVEETAEATETVATEEVAE
ncbi:MAG: hypothetical protein ACI3Z7_03210 [Candidatus Aphodosoma sp.]